MKNVTFIWHIHIFNRGGSFYVILLGISIVLYMVESVNLRSAYIIMQIIGLQKKTLAQKMKPAIRNKRNGFNPVRIKALGLCCVVISLQKGSPDTYRSNVSFT